MATDIMRQYTQMKSKHPDAVLLFRVGGFYECFSEDAITASDILGITLTRRNIGGSQVELAGFPQHALDAYLRKLVKARKRVAICEALDNPKLEEQLPIEKKSVKKSPMVVTQPSLFECCEPQKAYGRIPQIKLSYVSDSATRENPSVRNSRDIAKIVRESYEEGEIELREYFKAIYLTQSNRVLGIQTISMGGLSSTVVDAKLIYKGALLSNAAAVIVTHNHPSGNFKPSAQDDDITQNIAAGCKTLDLKLLDHIIVTADDYYSYADNSRI